MALELMFGIPSNQKFRVAKIIYDAFEDKYKHIYGSKEQTLYALIKFLREDRTIVAIHNSVVVGVGGLMFKHKKFIDSDFWSLVRILKLGIFRYLFNGWIFYLERVEEKELLIDKLAVSREMRGKGIGTLLIKSIIEFAASNGYKLVKLEVTDTNKRAKKLYKKMGFKEVNVQKILFPWNKIFGFIKVSEMEYKI